MCMQCLENAALKGEDFSQPFHFENKVNELSRDERNEAFLAAFYHMLNKTQDALAAAEEAIAALGTTARILIGERDADEVAMLDVSDATRRQLSAMADFRESVGRALEKIPNYDDGATVTSNTLASAMLVIVRQAKGNP